jgi:hypothetical protein
LIEVFSLVGLGVEDFSVERTTFKAGSSKMTKHEKIYSDNQHIFIQFIFDTFNFQAAGALRRPHEKSSKACISMLRCIGLWM